MHSTIELRDFIAQGSIVKRGGPMKGWLGRLCLAFAVAGAWIGPATADRSCITQTLVKQGAFTETTEELNGQCPITENNMCFDRLKQWDIINSCPDSFHLLLSGGLKQEPSFIGGQGRVQFSCREAHDGCTDLTVSITDRSGKIIGKEKDSSNSNPINNSPANGGTSVGVGAPQDADGVDWKALLAKVCTGPSITAPSCGAFCKDKGWNIDREANNDCVAHCTHARARCEAAKREDINTVNDENTLMVIYQEYLDRIRAKVKEEREAAARAEAAAAAKAVKTAQTRRQERQDSRPVQRYSPPAQTSRPPAEADLGYPPGCRNKGAYDSCIGGPQGCSAGSRLACQPLCSDFCND
jgi:hypothetical protein